MRNLVDVQYRVFLSMRSNLSFSAVLYNLFSGLNIVGEVLVIPSWEPKTSEYNEHERWAKIVDDYQDIKTH